MRKACFLIFLLLCCSAVSAQISVSPSSGSLGKYEIYELTITHNSGGYGNPWENVIIESTFTAPSNKKLFIGGFY